MSKLYCLCYRCNITIYCNDCKKYNKGIKDCGAEEKYVPLCDKCFDKRIIYDHLIIKKLKNGKYSIYSSFDNKTLESKITEDQLKKFFEDKEIDIWNQAKPISWQIKIKIDKLRE